MNVFGITYSPSSLAFITTYKCSASCEGCCFSCNGSRPIGFDFTEAKRNIENILSVFKSLKLVVFTGGECFLLGDDLFRLIKFVSNKKILTRCVSNAYWGKDEKESIKIVEKLKISGLNEINFTTGVSHLKFIPLSSVIKASLATLNENIVTVIAIEYKKKEESIEIKKALLKELNKKLAEKENHLLKIIQTPWIGDKDDFSGEWQEEIKSSKGCNNIFDVIVLTPEMKLRSCCGLFIDDIKEFEFVSLKNLKSTLDIKRYYEKQFNDFLKLWIKVEGPYGIMQYIKCKKKDFKIPKLNHICMACRYLSKNEEMKRFIKENYREKIYDIISRFCIISEINTKNMETTGYGI